MDESFLLRELSTPIGKNAASKLAGQSLNLVEELFTLCLSSSYELAFRASWVLELLDYKFPGHFNEHLDSFFSTYTKLKNQSCQRHFTKILMTMTTNHSKFDKILNINSQAIVEITFEWLVDPHTPVAVKVNCMDILYNLRRKEDWIEEELRSQIEFQLRKGSAALHSRGNKILNKLDQGLKKY